MSKQKELTLVVFASLHACLFFSNFILKLLKLKWQPFFLKFRVRCFFLSGKEYSVVFSRTLPASKVFLTFGRTPTWLFVTSRTIVVVVVEGIDGAEE